MALDPKDYRVFPAVFVVDEFRMTDDTGGLVTVLDKRFLEQLCSRMNEREAMTGDLCPVVIGHTEEGEKEVEQPQVVGVCRNWRVAPFFNTGRLGAQADFWIKNENRIVIDGTELTLGPDDVDKRWPRRSAEVWASRHEIDPVSLLGATTPARDLGFGLIRLSRNGSFTYFSPDNRTPQMPLQSPPMDAATAGAAAGMTGSNEEMKNLLQQILAGITQLVQAQQAPEPDAAAMAASAPGQPGGAPAGPSGGAPDELTDEELEQLLGGGEDQDQDPNAGVDEEASRKGEPPPVQNMGYCGGTNTHVNGPQVKKLSRQEHELGELRVKLARMEIKGVLTELKAEGYNVDPKDDALVQDLAAMPPDMRGRSLDRIKLSRPAPVKDQFNLESAIANSTNGTLKGRRMQTVEERSAVIKLARQKGISFEAAAQEQGYTL